MLSKHVALAVLEGREMLTRSLRALALLGVCVVVGSAAWFTLVAAVLVWAMPGASGALQLLSFSLVNALAATALARRAMRPEDSAEVAEARQVQPPRVDVSSEHRESEQLPS